MSAQGVARYLSLPSAVQWLLLIVLAANVALPAFTQEWLQFLPGHAHLFFGRPQPGWEHHEHSPPRHCRYEPADARALGSEEAPADGVVSLRQMPAWDTLSMGCTLCLLVPAIALPEPAALPCTVDLSPAPLTGLDHPPPERPPRLFLA